MSWLFTVWNKKRLKEVPWHVKINTSGSTDNLKVQITSKKSFLPSSPSQAETQYCVFHTLLPEVHMVLRFKW